MKHNANMDGQFQIDGKIIQYLISDNYSQRAKIVHGVEKITRTILFFDELGNSLGMNVMYGEFDKMQNISPSMANEAYKEMLNGTGRSGG